jgi:hypothetical protein
VKQKPDSSKRVLFTPRAMIASRAMLAVTLLLVLVAGGIVWPAAASGALCAMACCAGQAPHAAGSCLHGSCDAGVNANNSGNSDAKHFHHHQEQQQIADDSVPQAFAGALASAMGSDMAQVPTVDASEFETDQAQLEANSQSTGNSIAALALLAPCQPGCGACTSGFSASKRSRDTASTAGSNKAQHHSSSKIATGKYSTIHPDSNFYPQVAPRGPPSFAG